jgi:hypothetical protein
MPDLIDLVALNNSDKRGALDAICDVKQYQRNHNPWMDESLVSWHRSFHSSTTQA